jgi:hypothetical protein
MKTFIDIEAHTHILKEIEPFIELNGVQWTFEDIIKDDTYSKGGFLALMGLDLSKYKHLVAVSNNPFLGDNLTLTLPVVNYLKNIVDIDNIDVYLPYHSLFKSDERIRFYDCNNWLSISNKITSQTLVISFSLIEGDLKQKLEILPTDVLIGLNDRFTKFYSSGKIICNLECCFYNSKYFKEDYTEGIRNQLSILSKYTLKKTFDEKELIKMVDSYFKRINQNWINDPHWSKIFNGDLSGANDSLYSNVYEYDIWLFKLLFGPGYKWTNFKKMIKPESFTIPKNEAFSMSPFIFININVNTSKLIWQNNECGILDYVSAILTHSKENEYKVIFTHPSFDVEVNDAVYDLFKDRNDFASILFSDDIVDWVPLMKSAKAVVSFDTGFVHLAYLFNTDVLSVGGQSFFWHFPDSEYVNFNHIDNAGNVSKDSFNQSLSKVLKWIKND